MRMIDDLLPYVMTWAPSCAEPFAIRQLRLAAITFCQRTRCWREVDEFESSHDYLMCVPQDAALFELEKAWFDGDELERVPFSHLDGPLCHGEPRYISQYGPDSVRIAPFKPGRIKISMFLQPSQTADCIPDHLFNHHAQAVAFGALGEILMLPEQPFTNPQLAADYRLRFARELDRNFALNIRGQQRAPIRTKPHSF